MQIHTVGVDHTTAPIELLERLAVPPDRMPSLLARLVDHPAVHEAMVLATCNRLEAVLVTDRRSEATCHAVETFARTGGIPDHDVWESAAIRREAEAVAHLFRVACGLASMAVGEEQIVAQIRTALARAKDAGTAGPLVISVAEHALRTSKTARSGTRIGQAGVSLVHAGLAAAADELGGLRGRAAFVLGTGTMGLLSARLLRERGAGAIAVTSRTHANAVRIAGEVGGTAVDEDGWSAALERCDLLVSATGAQGHILDAERLRTARKAAGNPPMVALDLAMPRDIDPLCGGVDGVRLVDIGDLGRRLAGAGAADDTARAERVVADEAAAFLTRRLEESVRPLIVALRSRGREIVDGELARLGGRLPDLTDRERAETVAAVNRIVAKLLHTPITRVRRLAGTPNERLYLEALTHLFGLETSEASE